VEELSHDGPRVLIVHVPSRLSGTAWQCKGSFWMRAGDALVPMTDEQLRRIHEEAGPDFSAEPCPEAVVGDLDPAAIALLRRLWDRKAPGQGILDRPLDRLLADAELLVEGRLAYAALILLGTREALGRHLSQSELVFEYRSSDSPGPAADRREFRQGCLPVLDPLWERISLRNDLQHFQHRLFVWDVPTLDERAVREAVLNAVSHRDYRSSASIFVRQYPRRIEVVSPGGFPSGITPDNVLWQQKPRNRRIAEVLGRCISARRASTPASGAWIARRTRPSSCATCGRPGQRDLRSPSSSKCCRPSREASSSACSTSSARTDEFASAGRAEGLAGTRLKRGRREPGYMALEPKKRAIPVQLQEGVSLKWLVRVRWTYMAPIG
jgi:hypothetical protein